MTFEQDFRSFLADGADRLVRLSGMLAKRGLEGRVLAIGLRRHLLVRLSPGPPSTLLVAHYDRVDGSPGALDNSAACFVLAEAARRLAKDRSAGQGHFVLFTDGEEAPASGDPFSQGSYALAKGLHKALGGARPAIFVFDVVGRGSRLLLSTASRTAGEGLSPGAVLVLDAMEARATQAAATSGMEPPLRLPLPWSDDLGFALAGMPALVLSLLPEDEAERLERAMAGRSDAGGKRAPARNDMGGDWPRTWDLLHGPEDRPELLERRALDAMVEFCVGLCRSCGRPESSL